MVQSCTSIRLMPDENACSAADRLLPILSDTFRVPVTLSPAENTETVFSLVVTEKLSPMTYRLSVGENGIHLTAGTAEALWEGVVHFLTVFGYRTDNPAPVLYPYEKDYDPIRDSMDNSAYLPPILPDAEVQLEYAAPDNTVRSPDWLQDMVLAQVHLDTACKTFSAARKLIDFYAGMGVNAVWFCPVYDRDKRGNGYGNLGLHTVDALYAETEPDMTKPGDDRERYRAGWEALRNLVDYAHGRNVRIFLDVISWGVIHGSPLIDLHPDWFCGEAWGGAAFDWKNEAFCDWFVDQAAENLLFTGADGYRCDCEPNYGGYDIWGRVKEKCAAAGRKIVLICEDFSPRGRESVFDLEQDGVLDYANMTRGQLYIDPVAPYLTTHDITESVISGDCIGVCPDRTDAEDRGSARFYTHCVTNHDYQHRLVRGNRLVIGYQAVLAPFLPVWFCGDELGMDEDNRVIYFTPIEWNRMTENVSDRYFHEDLKAYLRIRRQYSEVIAYACPDHRETNILPVPLTDQTGVPTALRGYRRDSGNRTVYVLPAAKDGVYTCTLTLQNPSRLTDLMTGCALGTLPAGEHTLTLPIAENRIRVILAEFC
ncbi:MAG: hypothetical protein IKY52_06050 [Clostridia bacterium]|nr:hypothetical protein [Clostridia bacterium]